MYLLPHNNDWKQRSSSAINYKSFYFHRHLYQQKQNWYDLMSHGLIIKQISQRGRRLSEATADASLFSRRGGEVRSGRRQKQPCLWDGYSLALQVPKAVGAKRVGSRRDTEHCKWSAFGKHVIVFCSCQFVLVQKRHGPEGRQRGTNGLDGARSCTIQRPIHSFLKHHAKESNHGDKMDWQAHV